RSSDLALLGHAEVRRVQEAKHDIIFTSVFSGSMVLFQTNAMIFPCFAISAREARMSELKEHVFKVVRECLTKEALHVFEDECLGTKFANRPDRFREHVSLVFICSMLSAQRERLARRAA